MPLKSLVLAAALVVPACAWAQGAEPAPKAEIGFLRPANTLWRGSVALPPCTRPALRRLLLANLTPRSHTAAQERRGELVGEILAPAPLMADATRTAQACATAAAGAGPSLLLDSTRGWPGFHQAFAACMSAQHAETYVGGMTLWVDSRCNW